MNRILVILKTKKNDHRASSDTLMGLFSIIFKHVYWYVYIQQISGKRLQDHRSAGLIFYPNIDCGCLAPWRDGSNVDL